jgi:uncharacterized protein
MRWGLSDNAIAEIHTYLAMCPDIEQAILYGSRAKGSFREGSDIDLTLIGAALTPETLYKLSELLEDSYLPYRFDLSIMKSLDNPMLVEHIERVGQLFYTRDHAPSTPAEPVG